MSALLDLAKRIEARCVTEKECRIWTGARNSRGYGQISFKGRVGYVHRFAYEIENGPIPLGLQIDHLCRNRRCCNPAHLEAVTPRENTRRGNAGQAVAVRQSAITACPAGHSYDEGNTYVHNGKRYCKRCQSDRLRRRRENA